MKKLLLSLALAVAAPLAWAQVSETTTTTTTTEGSGTITEYNPGSVIVLKESSGPRNLTYGSENEILGFFFPRCATQSLTTVAYQLSEIFA